MEQNLTRKYQLESALLRMARRMEALSTELAQARYDQRSRKVALTEYKGSFRSFLDKLSGKQEDRAEALQRELRKADAALNALLREQESLRREQAAAKAELEGLPSFETLRQTNATPELYRLEARLCCEALPPLLEENYQALFELRRLERGERIGEIISIDERASIGAEPHLLAEQCRPWLKRLQLALTELDIPFQIGSYYLAPAAFLAVASNHNRRDRINQALDQITAAQKQVAKLLEQFND